MANFGGSTENPRRLTITGSKASPCGGAMMEGMILSVDSIVGAAAAADNGTTDDYECESEEGFEALADETPPKPAAPSRSSSKRNRAAEVHNLSEKRRRRRINEKMKALQKLVPNSNKQTDKASMLDEVIEYLKNLQLQVRMLSLRNGLSLHPMYLPGVLQPVQFSHTGLDIGDENCSQPMNVLSMVPANQETSPQMVFDMPNPSSSSNLSNIGPSNTSLGLESMEAQFGPFQLFSSSQVSHMNSNA